AAPKDGEKKEAKAEDKKSEEAKDGKEEAKPAAAKKPEEHDPVLFTDSEIDVLQSLAARREELNKREEQIQQKESLLQVAEERLQQKMSEMKTLQQEMETARVDIERLVKQARSEENERIKTLIKTYENMKPKDAARIFDQLEMPVLLDIIGGMKEAKISPILAAMDAGKAKSVTMELAKKKEIPAFAASIPNTPDASAGKAAPKAKQ
ncbi:MAG: MotE family protein, partial [Dongiaceae bacterium]